MLKRALFLITLTACLPAAASDVEAPQISTYRTVNGRALEAHVFVPTGTPSGAAVLLLHGGGWSVGEPEWVYPAARRFAELGLLAVAVEYSLADESVTPADALADTCAAFAWVRDRADELGIDVDRVAGYGVSAGGHLVAAAATVGCGEIGPAGRPDALLLWSPAVDVLADRWFERLLHGTAKAADYSPAQHVTAATPPTSIVHGEEDTLTPPSGPRTFCAQLEAVDVRCELHLYPGLGHLLTRNLANQFDDYDPDPDARADGIARLEEFLVDLGYTSRPSAS